MDSLWDSTLPKIHIISKKASNKSCSKLNFIQKSLRAHTSIYRTSEAAGLQRSVYLKSYNVHKWKSPPTSTPGWDVHVCSLTFLYEIQFRTTFIWTFFDVMHIFGSVEPQSESNFPFLYIIRFQIYWSLELPSSTCGGDRHMCLGTFLYEIQFRITLIWSFLKYCIFFASLSPKINLISHFCTLKEFEHTDLWSP